MNFISTIKQRFNDWWPDFYYWLHSHVINHDLVWWIRYRVEKRHAYHLADLNLNPAYYEVDTRMEVAVFELMREFVNQQLVHMVETWWEKKPTPEMSMFERGCAAIIAHRDAERETWETDDGYQTKVEYYSSLLEIYQWFHENRSLIVDGSFSPLDGEDWEEREAAFNAQLEHYMIKTIQLRKGMWT